MNSSSLLIKTFIAFFNIFWFCLLSAQNNGRISGRVIDQITGESLFGATILLQESHDLTGTTSDINGQFELSLLRFGTYTIRVNYLGYQGETVNDIAVYDHKGPFVEIALKAKASDLQAVVVSAYENPTESTDPMAVVSARSISIEESKRFAGGLGDPSRMALSYSGVNSGRGDNNEIIIRGNSAKYMQWKLEGMEIPNPNHFGVYGSSGGMLSIINSNILGRSDFYTGAFPAHTGNVIGGVFDLSLRDGNSNIFKHSIETSLIGLSASSEGPVKFNKDASYIINYRYSTLGLLKQAGIFYQAPEYQDISYKLSIPTNRLGKFSVYGIGGIGTSLEQDFFRKTDSSTFSLNNTGDTVYSYDEITASNLNRYNLGLVGIKHTLPLGLVHVLTNHLSLSLVYSAPRTSDVNNDNFTTYLKSEGRFTNTVYRYLSSIMTHIDKFNTLQMGVILSFRSFNSRLIKGYSDYSTQTILNSTARSFLSQSYVSWKNTTFKHLDLIGGFHLTYFDLNDQTVFEPRFGIQYKLRDNSILALASGLHSATESPEVYLILDEKAGNARSRDLRMSRSWQTVLSHKRKLANQLFWTTELYYQYLYDVPISADSLNLSLINEEVAFTDVPLVNAGKGLNYGIELTLEKFFSRSYYFLWTISLFQSEYKLMEPFYRKTKYSNSYTINLLGGKQFKFRKNRFLGLNVRSNFSGGKPYTPVLLNESIAANEEVRDVNRTNFSQLPPYFGLDLSISYRWIRFKTSHEVKLDIFRLFEQNFYDEVYVPEKVNIDGTVSKATTKQIRYGEGQTSSTILPILYYKIVL